jgi:hypothetical protein
MKVNIVEIIIDCIACDIVVDLDDDMAVDADVYDEMDDVVYKFY